MKYQHKSDGFTLVELMVVVLIIGILVSIAIPVFQNARTTAQRKSCFGNQRIIEGAVHTYQANVGDLPPAGVIGSTSWAVPNYIRSVGTCPMGDATSLYSIDAAGIVDGDSGGIGWVNAVSHQHYQ